MKTRLFILFLALAMQVVCADAVIKTIDEENIIDMCVSADKKTTTVIYYKEKKGILFKEKGYYVLQNDTLFGPYDELNYLGDKKKEVPIFLGEYEIKKVLLWWGEMDCIKI